MGGKLTYTTYARIRHPPRAHATTRQFSVPLTTLLKRCLFVNIDEEWGFFSSMGLRMNGNPKKKSRVSQNTPLCLTSITSELLCAKFRVGIGSSELGIKKVTSPMLAGTVFGRSR
jgi:hypothetical protein